MRTLLLIAACLLALATAAVAKRIEVAPDGPVTSISGALKTASDGDEIVVGPGVYPEHDLKVTRTVSLKGVGNPVIDVEGRGSGLLISADGVSVDGFTIINVGNSFTSEPAGIVVERSRQFSITNNVLKNVFFGILVKKCKTGKIAFNEISSHAVDEISSGNGIHLWHSRDVSIRDNRLHGQRDGIYLEFVEDSEISHNESYDNVRYGLHFMFSNDNVYQHNMFHSNGAGVAVMFSKRITMRHNRFARNWGAASYGLLLKEISDAEITDNDLEMNTVGIFAEGSNRIEYSRNRLSRNGWAVKIAGACYGNRFHANEFAHNTFDLSYNSNLNDNSFEGNYWSDYTGYDLDRDGVGDVAYRPVKLFSYVTNRSPESIVLLRSLFVDIINFSEKVSPVFTPDGLLDPRPLMKASERP